MATQLTLWDEPVKTLTKAPAAGLLATTSSNSAACCSEETEPPLGEVDRLSTLQQQIRRIETARRPRCQSIPSGVAALDDLLPQNGYPPGSLVEWITATPGSGGGWLSWLGAKSAHEQSGGKIVVLDQQRTFYPPAAIACGIAAEALIVLQPQTSADAMWALDQALRCEAVAAVCAPMPNLSDADARRLQLAAETGGTLGMLLRPQDAIKQPSWAEVRWQVHSTAAQQSPSTYRADRLLSVRLLRARGGRAGRTLVLQIDQQSRIVRKEPQRESQSAQRLAAELAHPKTAGRRQQPSVMPSARPARTA